MQRVNASIAKQHWAAGNAAAGFTLIEILVVITILLMVTAAAIPIMAPALENRRMREASRLVAATSKAPARGPSRSAARSESSSSGQRLALCHEVGLYRSAAAVLRATHQLPVQHSILEPER